MISEYTRVIFVVVVVTDTEEYLCFIHTIEIKYIFSESLLTRSDILTQTRFGVFERLPYHFGSPENKVLMKKRKTPLSCL